MALANILFASFVGRGILLDDTRAVRGRPSRCDAEDIDTEDTEASVGVVLTPLYDVCPAEFERSISSKDFNDKK